MKKVTFSIPWPLTGAETRDVLAFAFQVTLLSYLGFTILENLKPSFISLYFNLNTILWATIATGVMANLWPLIVPEAKRNVRPNWKEFVWMMFFAGGTVAVVWHVVSPIGAMVKIVAPLAGLIVLGLSLLVYYDRDDRSDATE